MISGKIPLLLSESPALLSSARIGAARRNSTARKCVTVQSESKKLTQMANFVEKLLLDLSASVADSIPLLVGGLSDDGTEAGSAGGAVL